MTVTTYGYDITAGASVFTGGTGNAGRCLKSPSTHAGKTLLYTAVAGDVLTKISVYSKATSSTGTLSIGVAVYEISATPIPTNRVGAESLITFADTENAPEWRDSDPLSITLTAGVTYSIGLRFPSGRHLYALTGVTSSNVSQDSRTGALNATWNQTGNSSLIPLVTFDITNDSEPAEVTGDMAATEAPDIFAGVGLITGAMAVTESLDTFSASQQVSGDMAATEAPDTFAAVGLITGSMAATETPDVFAAASAIVIDDAFERSSVDIANSIVTGLRVQVKPRRSHIETIGIRWFFPCFRLTGVLGLIPEIEILDYTAAALHVYPIDSTKRFVGSYSGDFVNDWFYLDNLIPNDTDDIVEISHDTAFTQNQIYIARTRAVSLTQMAQWAADLDTTYDFIEPSITAAAFTPVDTGDFPAPQFIAAEYAAKTDDLGRAVRETPYQKFMINDTSLMPTSGIKKQGILSFDVHAGEDLGDIVGMKYVNRLCSDWSVAQNIRRHFKIGVSLALNAYGRFAGSQRGSFGTVAPTDANRNYHNPSTTLDTVSVTKPIFLADFDGEIPQFGFDFHGTDDGGFNMFVNDGNTLQAEYRSRVDALYGPTVPDEGETPEGALATWWNLTVGIPLTLILEHGDRVPITDADIDAWVDANLEALDSMRIDGLIEGGDTGTSAVDTGFYYRQLLAG